MKQAYGLRFFSNMKWPFSPFSPPHAVRPPHPPYFSLTSPVYHLFFPSLHTDAHTLADTGSTSTFISPFHSWTNRDTLIICPFFGHHWVISLHLCHPVVPPGKSAASGPHRVQREGQEGPAEGGKGTQHSLFFSFHSFSIRTQEV